MEKPILYKRLSELKTSEQGVITKVFGHGSFRNRITEMGFVRGKAVKVIKNAPLLDPIEYEIMGYRIALRKSEAELIEVTVAENAFGPSSRHGDATFRDESVNRFLHEAGKTINVALVGNPNCGKTSLFNTASGSHERVGNYSGVTVDAKEAHFRQDGYTIRLFDLPGTYSITEYTPEELYVRAHLLNEMPDVVVNVVDASNLERNLLLTTQLIDMNLKVVIALNMYDELERSGDTLNYRDLGRMIGIPIIPTVANRKEGIDALFKTVIDVFEDNEPVVRHIHINYGADIEQSIRTLQAKIWENKDLVARYSSRYLAIRLLGNDKNIREIVASRAANSDEIDATAARLREKLRAPLRRTRRNDHHGCQVRIYRRRPRRNLSLPKCREEACPGRPNRPRDDAPDLGTAHFSAADVDHFPGHVLAGRHTGRMDGSGRAMARRLGDRPYARGFPARIARRRDHQRSGGRHRLSAEHTDPLFLHFADGGHGLHGARRLHHG